MVHLGKEFLELRPMNKDKIQGALPSYGVFDSRSSEDENASSPPQKNSSFRRSLILLVIGTTCLYSAVNANMSIVSSVANDSGLGFASLLVYAIVQLFISLVGNQWMASATSRRVLLIAMIALTIYGFLNVYISWTTLIIGAIFQGVGYSLQWIAGNSYTTELALWSARLLGTDEQVTLVRMFGLFNFAVQGGFVWGNLAVYFILTPSFKDDAPTMRHNQSVILEAMDMSDCRMCGARFYPDDAAYLPQMARPPAWRLFLLEGLFGALAVAGVIMIACVDHFGQKDFSGRPAMTSCKGFWLPIKQMALQLKDIRQLLLLPISVVIGMEQAFIMGEYTMSYVSCCLGIHSIGLVMVCFGAVDIVVCVLQEWVVKAIGRFMVITTGLSFGVVALLTMLLWHPTPHEKALYYVIAIFWSFFDAILITQVFALYGLLFQDTAEVNFSLGIVCVAVGFLLQFSYSLILNAGTKVSIMLAITLLAALSYGYLEYLLYSKKRKCKSVEEPVMNGIKMGLQDGAGVKEVSQDGVQCASEDVKMDTTRSSLQNNVP